MVSINSIVFFSFKKTYVLEHCAFFNMHIEKLQYYKTEFELTRYYRFSLYCRNKVGQWMNTCTYCAGIGKASIKTHTFLIGHVCKRGPYPQQKKSLYLNYK